jgi:restriction endonuclease S subunit
LDGLEAVELTFSQMLEDNEKFRIDSEFFKKDFLLKYKFIKSKDNKQLQNIVDILTDFSANGSYESIANNFTLLDEKNYAYMVRTTDLESLNYTKNVKYIDEHSYNFLEKSQVFGGEILINKIGSPGRVYQMPNLNMPVSLGMNLFMLRLSSDNHFTEEFIWAYFNSKFGKTIIKRKINGTVPLTIDKVAIKTLYVPNLSKEFQLKITKLISNSHQKLEDSKKLYKQSEQLLLKELDLLDFKPSKEKTSIKSFSKSFEKSGRLDSEYYQPKFDEIINKIKTTKYDSLENIVNINKSVEPGSEAYQDNGISFIRVSNLTKFGLSEPDIHLSQNLFDEETLEKLQPKKDTILLSKDGTVGIAYNIKENSNIITSGAILHLTINDDKVLPEYLTLVLNSLVVQMQSERDAGGSIIKHWKPSEIAEVLIPIIDDTIQAQIEEKIKESFKLQKESQQLLEVAKRSVEIAIEKDEEVAIKYIEESKNE